MSRDEVVRYLNGYARSFSAPVRTGVTITALLREDDGFRVATDRGPWQARNVVIATGHCDVPRIPGLGAGLLPGIVQVTPTRYRHPGLLPEGGVLVVGASATGVQLAAEIQRSGRPVTLAVGRHTRLPRRYRGRDIMAWLDEMGVLAETADQMPDLEAARRSPSLQLEGSASRRSLDLGVLQAVGVRLVGRAVAARDGRVALAQDLTHSLATADERLGQLLRRIDHHIEGAGLAAHDTAMPDPIRAPQSPGWLDLEAGGIRSVLWATGYRRRYPWLKVPVLDAQGEIRHAGGVTPVPGLYVLGLRLLRRRNSNFLDGVGHDARYLAGHIERRLERQALAAA
jgi:putative flavoprotein involved in K+ transport